VGKKFSPEKCDLNQPISILIKSSLEATRQYVLELQPGPSRILLREDDMIYLASISTFEKTKQTLKYLIEFALKAKYWITDLIYKLGRCNNREFLFLCAWLRLGYALDEKVKSLKRFYLRK